MQYNSFKHTAYFFSKIKNFDYILLICILLLGLISAFSMYSTDGGEIRFHSKSHISKFLIFFIMMIFMSFFNIKFWHYIAYLFYISSFNSISLGFTYMVLKLQAHKDG